MASTNFWVQAPPFQGIFNCELLLDPAALSVGTLTLQDVAFRLLSVAALIAINAFFVTAEFSMVSVRRSRISQLVEQGDASAKTVQALQRHMERLLSTTQLGITLSSLALGWIGEATIAFLVAALLVRLPLPVEISRAIAHALAIPIGFALIVYLQIVLGELVPKSLALLYSEQLARLLGPPSQAIARLFHPLAVVLNQSTRWLLRLGGVALAGKQDWYNRVTSEELQLIINTERESTGLEVEERELLNNIFEFGDVEVEEVMVPRTNIAAVSRSASVGELLELAVETEYSRFPVMGDSLDDILGTIEFEELAIPLARGQITLDAAIDPWIETVRFVPEFTPLSELLRMMRRSRQEMAMVVDEYGGTAGLVTIEDLVDRIIGNDSEPESTEEIELQMLDEQTFLVQAQMNLEEVNEILDLDLPLGDDYQTLGGFVLDRWQKVPTLGETLHYEGLELTVVDADGPRLRQIRIHRQEPSPSPSSETEGEAIE